LYFLWVYCGRAPLAGNNRVKRKPDMLLVLMAAFGLGVLLTLLLPLAATDSVAEPVSPLQAGVLTDD